MSLVMAAAAFLATLAAQLRQANAGSQDTTPDKTSPMRPNVSAA